MDKKDLIAHSPVRYFDATNAALKEGETIVIGIDEMEYMGNYLYKSLKAKYDKDETS